MIVSGRSDSFLGVYYNWIISTRASHDRLSTVSRYSQESFLRYSICSQEQLRKAKIILRWCIVWNLPRNVLSSVCDQRITGSTVSLSPLPIHTFFYKKLSSEMSTQFLSVLSTQFIRGFLSERDLRHFWTKMRGFLEKWLASFLCTWNMSTWFLNS